MKRSSLDRMRAAAARVAPGLAPSSWTEPVPAPPDRVFIDDHCPNCLAPLPVEERGLYCSPLCKETVKHVRWIRRKIRDPERLGDFDIQYTIGIRLGHLVAGGYDAAARRIPPGVRELVKARDDGKCLQCGEAGEEIDHVDGGSNEPGNLQLLCTPCHRAKTALRMKPMPEEKAAWIDELYRERIEPDPPAYFADDEIRWESEWPALLAARNNRLKAAGHRKPAARRRKFMPEAITLEFVPGQGLVPIDPDRIRERSAADPNPLEGGARR